MTCLITCQWWADPKGVDVIDHPADRYRQVFQWRSSPANWRPYRVSTPARQPGKGSPYLDLLNSGTNVASAVRFTRKWGLLEIEPHFAGSIGWESLTDSHLELNIAFYRHVVRVREIAQHMRAGEYELAYKVLNHQGEENGLPFAPLYCLSPSLAIHPVGDGSPHFCLEAPTLKDFIGAQLLAALCKGSELKACAYCGALFEVGNGHGKRSDSKYCKPAHRKADCDKRKRESANIGHR